MKKRLIIAMFVLLLIILYAGVCINPKKVLAITPDYEEGKTLMFQDYVPQLTKSGGVQYTYNENSFFPIMLWGGSDCSQLGDLENGGFNSIHTNWNSTCNNQHIIHSLVGTGIKIFEYNPEILRQWKDKNKDPVWLEQILLDSYHPIRLGYYIYDEYSQLGTINMSHGDWVEFHNKMREVYDVNGQNKVAAWANIAGYMNGCAFLQYTDVYSLDTYRAANNLFGDTNRFESEIKKFRMCDQDPTRSWTGKRQPMMVIFQAFKGTSSNSYVVNANDLRAQAYGSIVLGANGIQYFLQWREGGYPDAIGLIGKNYDPDLWNAVTKINREIDQYKKVWLSPTSKVNYNVSFVYGYPIKTLLKEGDNPNEKYLLLVNFSKYPISDVKITLPDFQPNKITSLLDNREMNIINNGIEENFEGLAVRLYKITNNNPAIPNCSNISGPLTVNLGETYSYTANFSSSQGNLGTEISIGQNGIFKEVLTGTGTNDGYTASMTYDWTPLSSPGTYDVFCRAWNDSIAECRGNANYVDGPPRYPCNGPNSNLTVEVLPSILLLGDLNQDGKIDISDHNILITDFGKTGNAGFIPADIIQNGRVDIFDYNVLVENFGKTN